MLPTTRVTNFLTTNKMEEKMIRCSVCGEMKAEGKFPRNRLSDGTVKVAGTVCNTCNSRLYRERMKEKMNKTKIVEEAGTLELIEAISKLNSLGYIVIKKEEYIKKEENDENGIFEKA